MPLPRLYVDQELAASRTVTLGERIARHAVRVLRCRAGDRLVLFDGSGQEFDGTVVSATRDRLAVELLAGRRPAVESPLSLRLVQGVSRGDRMDTVVQKATELGVRRLTPVLTARSVVRLDEERALKRLQHWQGVAESACEQCGRTVPPAIDPPGPLTDYLAGPAAAGNTRLLLQPGADANLATLQVATREIELLIGPEGGFDDAELAAATAAGFIGVSFGPRVLRTETAAIAALALLQARWGDLGEG